MKPFPSGRSMNTEKPLAVDGFSKAILLVALLSCIGLMLPMLMAGPLELDEFGTYWIAGDGPLTLWERSLNYENIPPLSPFVHWIFLEVFGETEFVFRLPSCLCYLAAIGFIWRLGCDVRDSRFGSLLALTLAWHPVLLDEVRIARCYGMTLLLSIVALQATLRWLRENENPRAAMVWTVASILLIWTHYLNATLVMVTSLVLAWNLFSHSHAGKFLLLISWGVLSAASVPLWNSLVRMSVWGEYFGFQAESEITEVISSFWWAGLPAALFLNLGLSFRKSLAPLPHSRDRRSRRLFLICGVLPMLAVALFCRGELASLSNPRYRTCIEAAGLCFWVLMVDRSGKSSLRMVAVCVGLLGTWVFCDHAPWHCKRLNTPQSTQWKQIAQHVNAVGQPGQIVFVQSGLGEAALLREFFTDPVLQDYVACRLGRFYLKSEHRRIGLPFVWTQNPEMVQWYQERIREAAASATPEFWLAGASDTDLNRSSSLYLTEMALNEGFVAAEITDLPQAKLILFRLKRTEP